MSDADLLNDAQTVLDVAAHFRTLKARTAEMQTQFGVEHRGYFTPSEDEQTRHLLVSYWQARSALMELIGNLRQHATGEQMPPPQMFIVAYAGALVLVDAARHLRNLALPAPVIKKLNEPEPHFGIPAGVYDAVQKSLTDPSNVVHLHHAEEYFCGQEEMLSRAAATGPIAQCLELAQSLRPCLKVPLSRYVSERLEVRLTEFVTSIKHVALAHLMYFVLEQGGSLVAEVHTQPNHVPALPAHVTAQLRRVLMPGDVIVVRKEHVLTNYFLPGFWPHAALYLGEPAQLEAMGLKTADHVAPRWSKIVTPVVQPHDPSEPARVLESQKDGVHIRSLLAPLASDAIAVIRPKLSQADVARAIARGMFHEGKPYDFDFDFTRSDRMVCTEVVYRSYEAIGGMTFELSPRAGRMTLAAEDLLRMAVKQRCFDVAAVYVPGRSDALLESKQACDVLDATLAVAAG